MLDRAGRHRQRSGGLARTPVFVGSAFVAQYPEGGGNFWVPLQYLLGLLDLGYDAWWLEYFWTRGDAARDRHCVEKFLADVRDMGVADRVVFGRYARGTRDEIDGLPEYVGMDATALADRKRDSLLLNLAHSLPAPLRDGFGRTALFDLDPGTFQIWGNQWDLGVGKHDAHVTIGMHLGAPDSPVPLYGVDWKRVWPAVHLPAWPQQAVLGTDTGAYTTITQWWSDSTAFLDGELYDCNKRSGFLPILSLPERTPVRIELAANVHPNELDERAMLARHGWHLIDPNVATRTPELFRSFVQRSRGELSAAKPAYVKARAGWISDRTLCYLASGRPCLVEATGAEAHLPESAGLRFFRNLDEAVEGLHALEADYAAASRAARRLAEEVFDTRVVLPGLLEAAGA
jgi:hypothetical protein